MEKHEFETIFTYIDVMNIQDVIVKRFGSREIGYSMRVNPYFGPRKKIPHTTPNYGRG